MRTERMSAADARAFARTRGLPILAPHHSASTYALVSQLRAAEHGVLYLEDLHLFSGEGISALCGALDGEDLCAGEETRPPRLIAYSIDGTSPANEVALLVATMQVNETERLRQTVEIDDCLTRLRRLLKTT